MDARVLDDDTCHWWTVAPSRGRGHGVWTRLVWTWKWQWQKRQDDVFLDIGITDNYLQIRVHSAQMQACHPSTSLKDFMGQFSIFYSVLSRSSFVYAVRDYCTFLPLCTELCQSDLMCQCNLIQNVNVFSSKTSFVDLIRAFTKIL